MACLRFAFVHVCSEDQNFFSCFFRYLSRAFSRSKIARRAVKSDQTRVWFCYVRQAFWDTPKKKALVWLLTAAVWLCHTCLVSPRRSRTHRATDRTCGRQRRDDAVGSRVWYVGHRFRGCLTKNEDKPVKRDGVVWTRLKPMNCCTHATVGYACGAYSSGHHHSLYLGIKESTETSNSQRIETISRIEPVTQPKSDERSNGGINQLTK